MVQVSLAERLRQVIDALGAVAGHKSYYLFGSALCDAGSPTDIDVLLVYPDGDLAGAHEVAERIRDIGLLPQFDVIALSQSEECELKFVSMVGATQV